ncbi:MAG: flagellar hook assembly protein FlgD [Pseudomonadota bacterium]|nr:flagellar hook assembly protein FlgD [Pseudomonadota bacterium]
MSTISPVAATPSVATTPSASGLTQTSAAGTQAQFLKLLTTQLQNQDPLNPMDNAQLTSQIAQINTVSGIATLNTSVQSLSSQFLQMQTLQGASLVGKSVVVPGNQIEIAAGVGQGGFQLTSAADAVKVDVVNQAGTVVDTMALGAQSAGTHSFDWSAGKYTDTDGLTFKVTATSGASALSVTPLMRDTVDSVSASGSSLQMQLQKSGTVDYSKIVALN